MKQMSAEGTNVSFKYDHNGMRVQKVVEQSWYPETTNYIYHGKTLTHMTTDYTDFDEVTHQDEMHFFYDAQSRPVKVEFNGTMYTYLSNLQGDIVGILDNAGTLVVEYKYDAWGKPLSTTGTLAGTLGKRNPFRYRGYVYDEETGLYWLKERYYCSKLGRFIHADTVYTSLGDLGSSNRYAYCRNSPIELADGNGNWPSLSSLLGGIAVAAVAVAAVAITVATCGLAAPVLAGVGVASTTVTTATIVAGAALTTAAVATTAAIVYELEPKDYTVYCLADPVTGEVQYVGRTKNYEQRMRAHRAPNSRTNKLIPVVRIDHLTYAEARGLEEIGMAYYHTRKFLNETGENLIRGIGLKK